jgi:allantoinase
VQDQPLAYMSLQEQQKTILRSTELLQSCSGKKITGWGSPVVAFTPETAGFLAKAGLKWTCDVTYADLPIRIHTPHGVIAGVPTTDFSDNRVMRASPRDLFDAYKGTFDYLSENEPMSLLVMVIHCQFGGRPLMTAVVQEILKYIGKSPDVWFARHEELANWALAEGVDEHSYRERYFA